MAVEWCQYEHICLGIISQFERVRQRCGYGKVKVPPRVRCKKCKKRFKPYFKTDHDGDLRWYLPKHK